ncbi:Sperm nuclear basic protein PL-I isoform plia [Rhodotorula toruloides]|uniref:Sperm nuclear basic protein PL-I isoform plia n=1 Tax=Rhodotorula toruloides TaxID=5286 RepID=A0A2T0AE39_RHOTO|nr:Sperm nuclear basic protein PL-I isoform plia [Rhodotorula toruloides]PRQ76262.1 sperm nuclear basic protein PL-I isoform plia [Rhodotorula toruloides]
MDALDLRPLHQVYQTLDPATTEPLAHPLVCISELRRRPPPKRSARAASAQPGNLDGATELGEVEWVLMIGGEGLVKGAPEQKGKKKSETAPEEWWKACLCGREVEELMKQTDGVALSPQAMVPKVRSALLAGEVEISGYDGPGADPRGALEVTLKLTPTLPLTMVLAPCDSPPLSLMTCMAKIIPTYLVAAQEREAARSATAQLAVLRLENDKLQKQVNDFKEERKRARKVPNGGALRQNSGDSQRSVGGASFGRRTSSQDQSQSQSQSQMYSQSQGQRQSPDDVVFSPPKKVIPGETRRGALKPGDVGYAGSSFRPGLNLEEAPWDEDPPTDSD